MSDDEPVKTLYRGVVPPVVSMYVTRSIDDTGQQGQGAGSGFVYGDGYVVTNDHVVGVNRAKAGDNIGFAIGPAIVTRVVPALIRDGAFRPAYLSVRTLDVSLIVAEATGWTTLPACSWSTWVTSTPATRSVAVTGRPSPEPGDPRRRRRDRRDRRSGRAVGRRADELLAHRGVPGRGPHPDDPGRRPRAVGRRDAEQTSGPPRARLPTGSSAALAARTWEGSQLPPKLTAPGRSFRR